VGDRNAARGEGQSGIASSPPPLRGRIGVAGEPATWDRRGRPGRGPGHVTSVDGRGGGGRARARPSPPAPGARGRGPRAARPGGRGTGAAGGVGRAIWARTSWRGVRVGPTRAAPPAVIVEAARLLKSISRL